MIIAELISSQNLTQNLSRILVGIFGRKKHQSQKIWKTAINNSTIILFIFIKKQMTAELFKKVVHKCSWLQLSNKSDKVLVFCLLLFWFNSFQILSQSRIIVGYHNQRAVRMMLQRFLFVESGIFWLFFYQNGSKYEFCNNFFIKKNTVFSNIAEGSSVGFKSSKGGLFKKWQDITF